jgi:chloramphenicol 3-O-phosphotransferase
MAVGTIILLNGTVSAGKTSLARTLQDVMGAPYLHLGADILGAMCPPAYAGGAHTDAPARAHAVIDNRNVQEPVIRRLWAP